MVAENVNVLQSGTFTLISRTSIQAHHSALYVLFELKAQFPDGLFMTKFGLGQMDVWSNSTVSMQLYVYVCI